MNILAQSDIVNQLDYISTKSDRWLFLCAMAIMIFGAYITAKIFLKHYEQLIADHRAAREQHRLFIEKLLDQQVKTSKEMSEVVASNSEVMRNFTAEFRVLIETIGKLEQRT